MLFANTIRTVVCTQQTSTTVNQKKMNLYKNTDSFIETKGRDAAGPQEWPGAKDCRARDKPASPLSTPHHCFSLNICFILFSLLLFSASQLTGLKKGGGASCSQTYPQFERTDGQAESEIS